MTKKFRTRLQTRQLVVKTMNWPVRDACKELQLSRTAIYNQREKLAKMGLKDYLANLDYRTSDKQQAKMNQRKAIICECLDNGLTIKHAAKAAKCTEKTAYTIAANAGYVRTWRKS